MGSDLLRKLLSLFAVLVMGFAVNCGEEETPVTDGDGDGDVDGDSDGDGDGDGDKEDAWDQRNNPANFGNDFEYSWEALRQYDHGESEIIPWPDTYWPMTEDGYNARWQGNEVLSPVELYDMAFNDWTPPENYTSLRRYRGHGMAFDAEYYNVYGPAAQWAHESGGNHRARQIHDPDGSFTDAADPDGDGVVNTDYNGDGDMDNGDDEGGLEGWFGHCHAWAPAAFSAPEPQHPVTVNNVTFEIADIKALIEATHEGCGGTLFLGGRCNLREIERDEFGRIVESQSECRDTNAGSFHVVMTNVVGRLGRSFVADITTDYQVWNHPVRSYDITTNEEVDLQTALQLINRTDVQEYPYNDDASRFVHVEMTFRYVVEGSASASPYIPQIDSYTRTRNYEYLLELDAEGEIVGGEWISTNQPDFLWAPSRNCDARHGGFYGGVVVAASDVQTLVDMSTSTNPPPPTGEEFHFDAAPALEIPDNDASGVANTIAVGEDLMIADLRVNVNITHTYVGDLVVALERDGQRVVLHDREGGSQDNLVASFPVDAFNGQSSTGDWTLTVSDNAGADVGQLDSWRLTVITGVQ